MLLRLCSLARSVAVLLGYRFIGEDAADAEHDLLGQMPLQPLLARLVLQQPRLFAPHRTQTRVATSNSEESGIGRTCVCVSERERVRVRAVHTLDTRAVHTLAMRVRAIHTRPPAHAHACTRMHAHIHR